MLTDYQPKPLMSHFVRIRGLPHVEARDCNLHTYHQNNELRSAVKTCSKSPCTFGNSRRTITWHFLPMQRMRLANVICLIRSTDHMRRKPDRCYRPEFRFWSIHSQFQMWLSHKRNSTYERERSCTLNRKFKFAMSKLTTWRLIRFTHNLRRCRMVG